MMPDPERSYLDMSPEELDLEIGRLALAEQFGSKPVSDAEARAVAGRWFAMNLARLRSGVCAHPLVQSQLLDKGAQNRNDLFAAIADAVAKLAAFGIVPVTLLSARLVHYGVNRLCAEAEARGQSS